MDINDLLSSARLPEKEVRICLRPDLVADFEAAEVELAAASALPPNSLAAGGSMRTAAEKVEALRAQMLEASVTFRLRAVPRRRWTALYGEHPPREGDTADRATGFNRETFFEAMARECVAEPALTKQQWETLLDHLSAGQYDALVAAAWEVNRQGVDVPFSLAASQALTSTEPA